MTVHGNHGASHGVAARHHLTDGLAEDAGGLESCLPTKSDRGSAMGKGHINVQTWTKRGQTYRRLDGIEDATQT